jgi:hypothetical protein
MKTYSKSYSFMLIIVLFSGHLSCRVYFRGFRCFWCGSFRFRRCRGSAKFISIPTMAKHRAAWCIWRTIFVCRAHLHGGSSWFRSSWSLSTIFWAKSTMTKIWTTFAFSTIVVRKAFKHVVAKFGVGSTMPVNWTAHIFGTIICCQAILVSFTIISGSTSSTCCATIILSAKKNTA